MCGSATMAAAAEMAQPTRRTLVFRVQLPWGLELDDLGEALMSHFTIEEIDSVQSYGGGRHKVHFEGISEGIFEGISFCP